MMNSLSIKSNRQFLLCMAVVNFITLLVNCQWRVRSYNTTMLALDYKNGFTSRALLGTIYHRLDDLLPFSIINYTSVCVFAGVVTVALVCLLLYFANEVLVISKKENHLILQVMLMVFSVLVTATFSGGYNMLRIDEFMLATSLIGILLLMKEKAEWVVVLLSAIGVMFHQGYVFMYFNILLVALIVKYFDARNEKKKKYYGLLFVLSFVVGSILFLYFELLSRTSADGVYERVLSDATALSYNGIYHSTLLAHEVLGIDLGDTEYGLRMVNRIQFPFFIVCMLPYLILLVGVLASMWKKTKNVEEKVKYFFVAAGALTMLPDFLLKVDYGRWVMSVVSYYLVMLCFLLARGDDNAKDALHGAAIKIKVKPTMVLFFIYPLLLIPYWDVDICEAVRTMNRWLAELFEAFGGNVYNYFKWY